MLGNPAIGEKIRGIKYKFCGGSKDVSGGQDDRRGEDDEWTPVLSFSNRVRGRIGGEK